MPGGLAPQPGRGVLPDDVVLGHVLGSFGVRGELRLFLHNPASDLLARPREVTLVAPDGRRFGVRLTARPGAGKRVLARLDGLDDRDAADALANWQIVVPAAALPRLADGEFYVRELLGAAVFVDGVERGRVDDVQTTAGGDVLVVRSPDDTHFVPLVKAWVLGVDVVAGRVDLASGALDEA